MSQTLRCAAACPLDAALVRLGRVFGALLTLVCLALSAAAHAQAPQRVVLDPVNVLDVRSGAVQADRRVVLEGGVITAIGPSSDTALPGAGKVIDARGQFLIPGLWDMHVHLEFGDWFPNSRDISLPMFLANGVTGVRDMGSELEVVQGWRTEIEAGRRDGPRILTSGPMLDGPKPRFPASIAVATPQDGRRAVAELKRRGADFIKLQSLIPREAVLAIAEEAKKQKIVFVGHVPDAMRAAEMSSAGMRSFEHLIGILEGSVSDAVAQSKEKTLAQLLDGFDPKRFTALAAQLSKNQTWQCPTLVWERGATLLDQRNLAADPLGVYAPASWKDGSWKRFRDEIIASFTSGDLEQRKRFVQKELELVLGLHRAGVPFLAGTDTPPGVYIFPGFSLHDELQRFVDAGFTPLEALQTATLNPARFFGLERKLGSIEVGKQADLVLLASNPLEDIANTRKISAVISHGRYYDRAQLDALLAGARAAAARSSVAPQR